MWSRAAMITPCVSPTPEHVQGRGGELHLRGLEERLPNHVHAGRQQRACGGRTGGPAAGRALGESSTGRCPGGPHTLLSAGRSSRWDLDS